MIEGKELQRKETVQCPGEFKWLKFSGKSSTRLKCMQICIG